jgi:uncharacterized protein (TIGR03437 family)
MPRAVLLWVLCPLLAWPQPVVVQPPYYTSDSITNAADYRPDYFAPNTLVTIYGKNLSYSTVAATRAGNTGTLPLILGEVRVAIAGTRAHLLYVSPEQINLLLPADLSKGLAEIRVDRNGVAGPNVKIKIDDAAPAAFQIDRETIIATHADGTLITRESPARPEEVIVVYGTGLGRTSPPQNSGQMAPAAAVSEHSAKLRVEVGGVPLPVGSIYYAGITPGFAGLYQINLRMPAEFPEHPEIRFIIDERSSAEHLVLPAASR